MFVGRPIAQIMNVKIDNLILLCSLHHALAQRRAADFGKQCEDVDVHSEETSNAQRRTSNIESITELLDDFERGPLSVARSRAV
jgi:hypothetical protein